LGCNKCGSFIFDKQASMKKMIKVPLKMKGIVKGGFQPSCQVDLSSNMFSTKNFIYLVSPLSTIRYQVDIWQDRLIPISRTAQRD
jgi:hypothetical protein